MKKTLETVEGDAGLPSDMSHSNLLEHAVIKADRPPIDFDVYIAGPFFNDVQIETMNKAIEMMEDHGLKVFDPRKHGPVLGNMDPQERKKHTKAVLDANFYGVTRSYMTIACIDDRDTGTAWELGLGYGLGIPQITFSGRGFGANVMIAESVGGHMPTLDALDTFLDIFSDAIIKREVDLSMLTKADTID